MSRTLPEDDAEAVLQKLEDSGIFDELRKQLMDQISENVRSCYRSTNIQTSNSISLYTTIVRILRLGALRSYCFLLLPCLFS